MLEIYAQPEDTPSFLINEVSNAKETEVRLHLPKGSPFWTDPENLKLLKKIGETFHKRIILVIPEEQGRNMASEMGFEVVNPQEDSSFFASLEKELKQEKEDFYQEPSSTKRPRTTHSVKMAEILKKESALKKKVEPQLLPEEPREEESSISQKPDTQEAMESGTIKKINYLPYFKWAVIGVLLVGGFIWFYFFLPKAEIEISTQKQELTFDIQVTVDKNTAQVSLAELSIPGQFILLEESKEESFKAGGEQSFSQKAHGRITVFNEQSVEQPMIPSRFQASGGQIYWSQSNIVIPAASQGKPGSLVIEVVAAKAGEDYNLTCSEADPCSFTIPAWKGTAKFSKVYAKATTPLSGGKVGYGKVVTEQDLEQAKTKLISSLKEELQKTLEEQLPIESEVIPESVTFGTPEFSTDKSAGEAAESFQAKAKLTLRALLIKKEDLFDLVDQLLASQLSEDKLTLPQTIRVQYEKQSLDLEQGVAILKVEAQEQITWRLDPQKIKQELAGKDEVNVRKTLLAMDKIEEAQVRLWPFWVKRVPVRESRIEVILK